MLGTSCGNSVYFISQYLENTHMALQVALVVTNPSANAGDIETWVGSLGLEDPLEEGMATHSSIFAGRIP